MLEDVLESQCLRFVTELRSHLQVFPLELDFKVLEFMSEQSKHPVALHSESYSMIYSETGKSCSSILFLEPIFYLLDFVLYI